MGAKRGLACLGVLTALASAPMASAQPPPPAAPSPPTESEQLRQWGVLAERGNAEALFNLGNAYRQGRGVPRDLDAAEALYARAARNNHVEAQGLYGLLLIQRGATEEGLDQVERAARRGDPRAQYVLGTALFYGDGLAADRPRALALMARAAAGGFALAQTQLAEMQREMAAQAPAGESVALAQAAPPAAPPVAPVPAPAAPASPPRSLPMTAPDPQSAVPDENSPVKTAPAPAVAGTAPTSVGSPALSPAAQMPPGNSSTDAPTPAEIEMALAPQGTATRRRTDPPMAEPAPIELTPTEPSRAPEPETTAPAETAPVPAATRPTPSTAPAPVPVEGAPAPAPAHAAPIETAAVEPTPAAPMPTPAPPEPGPAELAPASTPAPPAPAPSDDPPPAPTGEPTTEAPVETTAIESVPAEPMPAPAPPAAPAVGPAMAAVSPPPPPGASAPAPEPAPAANLQIEPPAPAAEAPAPARTPTDVPAAGRWRLQLGAFRVDGNARRAWQELQPLLPGLQPYYARQGDLTLLQAGPLSDRGAARRACAVVRGAGHQCLPWGPPSP